MRIRVKFYIMDTENNNTDQKDEVVIKDLIGKVTRDLPVNRRGPPILIPYTPKTARFFGGYGGGIWGKMISKGDPDAVPQKITKSDIDSWSSLERFAYRHHTFFFLCGVVLSLSLVGLIYYFDLNPFLAVFIFCIFLYPLLVFIRTLFVIEGQSIPTKNKGITFFPWAVWKDAYNESPNAKATEK